MKIAILNNASNYLCFNINLAKYLELHNHEVVFLNTDNYIRRILSRYKIKVDDYVKDGKTINYYNNSSGLVKYYKRINNIKNEEKLIQEKNLEYSKALAYFKTQNYDCVIILNGAFHVETDVCNQLGIRRFFFEHGYFPNSIQMDEDGVNCLASCAHLSLEDFLTFKYKTGFFKPLSDYKIIKIKQNLFERYFYRLQDPFYSSFFINLLKRKNNQFKAKKRFQKTLIDNIEFVGKEPFIFFPLQVNSDTQIILNSTYSSMYAAVEDILPKLKETGIKIIIKEHPLEVEPVNYARFIDNKQVFLVKKFDLNTLIKSSAFVVNINSSVGLQAIALYKKVLLLGNSLYGHSPISVDFQKNRNEPLLELINQIQVNKNVVDDYIHHFKENIFIPGHFYSPTIDLFERIRNRLDLEN